MTISPFFLLMFVQAAPAEPLEAICAEQPSVEAERDCLNAHYQASLMEIEGVTANYIASADFAQRGERYDVLSAFDSEWSSRIQEACYGDDLDAKYEGQGPNALNRCVTEQFAAKLAALIKLTGHGGA